MYSVIQFSDPSTGAEGSVSIVNRQWMTPHKCEVYWPPARESKVYEPDVDTWKLYGVRRVFYETSKYYMVLTTFNGRICLHEISVKEAAVFSSLQYLFFL